MTTPGSTEPKFYVELLAEADACTFLPKAVFEGRIVQGGPEVHPFTSPARQAFLIDGPAEVASRHRGLYADLCGGFAEVKGPARMLSLEEYDALIEGLEAGCAVRPPEVLYGTRPADMSDAEFIAHMEQNYRRAPASSRFSLLEFMGMSADEYAGWIMHGTVPERVMRVAGRRPTGRDPRGKPQAAPVSRLPE